MGSIINNGGGGGSLTDTQHLRIYDGRFSFVLCKAASRPEVESVYI